jgi:hypothetical protein
MIRILQETISHTRVNEYRQLLELPVLNNTGIPEYKNSLVTVEKEAGPVPAPE